MRSLLDKIYTGAGWASAFTILAIAFLISAQVILNFATRVLGLPLPSTIPSYSDFSGYMLAAATFLAMPYTFRSGGHIRVSLITARLPARARHIAEVATLAAAALIVGYACYFIVTLVLESIHYGDMSSGIVAIPLAYPQGVMAVGMVLLLIAVVDSLIETIATGASVIADAEEI